MPDDIASVVPDVFDPWLAARRETAAELRTRLEETGKHFAEKE